MLRPITVGESVTVYFDVRLASDYNSPALDEAGGQPQLSKNGSAFDSYGLSTLTAVGYGRYSAVLSGSLISLAVGDVVLTRYKGVLTSETAGDSFLVVPDDSTIPEDDISVAYYGDLVHANLFFSQRLNVRKWETATANYKQKSLIMATQLIDRLNFVGSKSDASQILQFPRDGDVNVPGDIKIATYHIAYMLLDGYDPEIEAAKLTKTMSKYQSVQSFYERDFIPEYKLAGIPSAQAWSYLKPYLRDTKDLELERV
jgi:hypothetical protein